MLLTGAAGGEACSPGRVGLVLIQFVGRCVQHHQEEKSGPQRHRPLSTGYTTKQTEKPPAVCVIHKNDAPRKTLLQRPGDGADSAGDKWSCRLLLGPFPLYLFLINLNKEKKIFFGGVKFPFTFRPLAILPTCIDR